MQLLYVVFGKWYAFIVREDYIKGFRISCYFLLISSAESFDSDIAQKLFDLAIGKTTSLNTRGRAYTFNGGDTAKRGKSIRSSPSAVTSNFFPISEYLLPCL